MCILFLKVVLVLVVLRFAVCDVIYNVFDQRLNYSSRSLTSQQKSEAEKLLESFGYPFQQHDVISEDGYMLKLHRIPYSKRIRSVKLDRPVVLFHHGLLSASDSWLFRGPSKDLLYQLADAGYDVWIINARGNVYSRKHINMNADKDPNYWKFSFHEMGLYDLPAIIDYVLLYTKQKDLYFVGHSMGATTAFVLCSMKPEYNKKIRLISGLAPTAFVIHKLKPFMKLFLTTVHPLMGSLEKRNITEIFPRRELMSDFISIFCKDKSPTQQLCLSLIFLFVGVQNDQFDTSMFPLMSKYYPSGTSLDTVTHFYQIYTSGFYRPMDYGRKRNMIKYKTEIPPKYNLTKITAPVAIYYGDGDFLVTKEDNEYLAHQLPNVVGIFRVPHPYFNHMDFMWGTDSKKLIYDPLIRLMNKFR